MFLHPDFLTDAKISAIRVHLKQIELLTLHGFSGIPGTKMGAMGAK